MNTLRNHLRSDHFPPGASLAEIAQHLCRRAWEEGRPRRADFIAQFQNANRDADRELISEHRRTLAEIRRALRRELGDRAPPGRHVPDGEEDDQALDAEAPAAGLRRCLEEPGPGQGMGADAQPVHWVKAQMQCYDKAQKGSTGRPRSKGPQTLPTAAAQGRGQASPEGSTGRPHSKCPPTLPTKAAQGRGQASPGPARQRCGAGPLR